VTHGSPSSVLPAAGVIWVTGFSGSGKTTVARHVERTLREQGHQVAFLDGDDLRSIFAGRWGYGRSDRVELAHVYFRLSSHLASQGITVVIAAVAMYAEVRTWVRSNIPHSVIAYLEVPRDVRLARDERTKGVYRQGTDLEEMYDEPSDADVRVANHGDTTPAEAAATVVRAYLDRKETEADRGKTAHWDDYYAHRSVARQDPSPFAVAAAERMSGASSVLEVGCGNGRDTAYLVSLGHQVVGLDPSAAAIDLCRRTYAREGFDGEFAVGVLPDHATQWKERFDVLYSRFVLHAMTEAEELELWRDAATVMRPGALLALECRSINDPLARQGEVLSPTERIAGHYRRFIVWDELQSRLHAAGFEITDHVESQGLAVHGEEDPVVIRVFAQRA
jgi:bifunctional enzyme CysN/CysC